MDKKKFSKSTLIEFSKSPYLSAKHSNYFKIYDSLLSPYVSKKITVVEVGVAHGGSLFMWKSYFGKKARIIGIDHNTNALRWQSDFEIFIGDQSDPEFWKGFFKKIGNIDILIDDGGHKNLQQIVTVASSIPYINDGGLVIVEDVHTSFWNTFGNPQKHSFFNFAVLKAANLTRRHNSIKKIDNFVEKIFKIEFYDSIVAFKIDEKGSKPGHAILNKGSNSLSGDFIKFSDKSFSFQIRKLIKNLSNIFWFLKKFRFTKSIVKKSLYFFFFIESKFKERNSKKYFQ